MARRESRKDDTDAQPLELPGIALKALEQSETHPAGDNGSLDGSNTLNWCGNAKESTWAEATWGDYSPSAGQHSLQEHSAADEWNPDESQHWDSPEHPRGHGDFEEHDTINREA